MAIIYNVMNFHIWWRIFLFLALNVVFLLNVKLNIIEITIPPILDKTNKDDVIKNKLNKVISIRVAIPPVMQNRISFDR